MTKARRFGVGLAAAALAACAGPGVLGPPPGYRPPRAAPCPVDAAPPALACFAPVLLQEVRPPADRFDRPMDLDFDHSGLLWDDAERLPEGIPFSTPIPYYSALVSDDLRLYLFYGLYYPVDWSGDPDRPSFDHLGDFEGALVVASRATGLVEAVITQAHNLYYLWTPSVEPPAEPGISGTVPLTETGRPVLFSESGGHGLYAFGSGRWQPDGGSDYPEGPAGVPPDRLLRIDPDPGPSRHLRVEIRSLDELRRFTDESGAFEDLPRGAKPPWLWSDKRGGELGRAGAILSDPGALYAALRRTPRP